MTEQLIEAAILLAVGMTVVFAFLTMLIAGIKVIAWYAAQYPSPADAQNKLQTHTQNKNNNKPSATTVNPDIVAAISTAVHIHRNKSK
ncbi:OadG family protein [Glaciecola siphonariae]|uniref:Probable oxaloacetate decarboxylase gamma chain n=1 Tax=Glaciecola siphonariae TaxID=521012 RepID=A0ABV9LTQ4_9ALTE